MLSLAIILLVVWVLGFVVFKVAAFFIHVLLLLALVAVVMHFVRKARSSSSTL